MTWRTTRGPNQSDVSILGLNLTLDWDVGPFSIRSVTAFRDSQVDIGQDLVANPSLYIDWVDQDIEMETVTQELQLSGTALNDRLELPGRLFLDERDGQPGLQRAVSV